MTKKQVNIAIAYLQKYGFKITEQRVSVLSFLISVHEPVSIDVLTKKIPDVNQVTLYRMLKQFVDKGLVYQTDFRSGKAHFEFQEHHHHHLVCTSCGVQEAVAVCLPKEVTATVLSDSKKFSAVSNHSLEFFGVCKRCFK